ncbi:MAG: hypothetical protein ACLU38_10195 [Dysosmobacter sp.]
MSRIQDEMLQPGRQQQRQQAADAARGCGGERQRPASLPDSPRLPKGRQAASRASSWRVWTTVW